MPGVSRFRSRGSAEVTSTSAISGPPFTGSSPSAALQSSLESKLRQAMDLNGSLEFALTWKPMAMPLGLPICALRASARRTTDPGVYFVAHADTQHVATRQRREHHWSAPQWDPRNHLDPVHSAPNFWADFTTPERQRLKPDTQLLVDGFQTRLAQLYAFGNTIVPQVAAQFIIASREAIKGLSRRERYQGLDAFDRVSQRPAHRPAKSENVHSSGRPSGNSVAAFLRRLRTARPDLHARVLAGEISAYAGMIEAGWRTRPSEVGREKQPIGS